MKINVSTDEHITRYYNENGNTHRPNGPAVIWATGDWDWLLNGKWHRYYGVQTNPTFSFRDEWYLHGELIKEENSVR